MCGALAYVCFVPKADIHLRGYFARFHTNSSVTPAGVRGFVNFISSAVMDEINAALVGCAVKRRNYILFSSSAERVAKSDGALCAIHFRAW